MRPPSRCVVDTNVVMTADGRNAIASEACRAASGRALQGVMNGGHLFVDDRGLIVKEYLGNVQTRQPTLGSTFLKWVLNNQWHPRRVSRVSVTPTPGAATEFAELAVPPSGTAYDPSDQKFLAVASAHPDRPPVLQTLDSKWWGWQKALSAGGVTVHFLCPSEIADTYAKKLSK
jgi:hypothetical protein